MPRSLPADRSPRSFRAPTTISARIDSLKISLALDRFAGAALLDPPERKAIPIVCAQLRPARTRSYRRHYQLTRLRLAAASLVEEEGTPTRRGVLFSFFHAGEGLAIAAGLEDEHIPSTISFSICEYPGPVPRFAGERRSSVAGSGFFASRFTGGPDHPGYLEMGFPVQYGSGASEVIRELVTNPAARYRFTNESLRHGDIERALRMAEPPPAILQARRTSIGSVARLKKPRRISSGARFLRPRGMFLRSCPRSG